MFNKKTVTTTTKKTAKKTTHARDAAFALGREAALRWIVESGGAGFHADVTIRSYGLPGAAPDLMQRDQIDPRSYDERTAYETAFTGALEEGAQAITDAIANDWSVLVEEIGDAVDEVVQQIRADDAAEAADLAAEEEAAE